MPTLLEQQRRFRAWILGDEAGAPAEVLGRRMGAAARLAIYRSNVLGNLTAALRLGFPAIDRLVGDAFFDQAARRFIADALPASADLYEFGADFPAFLAGYAPARTFSYLADVAALEWAVGRALHAADAPRFTTADLAACTDPDIRFAPDASLSLLRLGCPAHAVWSAVLTEDAEARARAFAAIDLRSGGEHLAVLRDREGLAVIHLSPIAFSFAHALVSGTRLSSALHDVPDDAAPVLLADFVSRGFFAHPSDQGSCP